jgi:hypothetical protein
MSPSPVNIVDCRTQRGIGAAFRQSRPGPEEGLVDWLIGALPFEVPPTCRATVFREPRLDSGFPDLVIVVWHPATMQKWASARDKLTPADLRLLQYLVSNGPADEDDLRAVFSGRQLRAALDRLEEAILVRRFRSGWAARSIQKSFAVRNIIAVEAKVADWQRAAQQAYLNTWFTPESYVLLPDAAKGHPLRAAARKLGIGVVSKAQGLVRRPRTDGALPRSYASWLFNEWAWRASRRRSR